MLANNACSLHVRQMYHGMLGQPRLADRGQLSPPRSVGEAASGVPCPVPGLQFRRDTRKLEGRDGDGPGAHDLQGEREGAGLG